MTSPPQEDVADHRTGATTRTGRGLAAGVRRTAVPDQRAEYRRPPGTLGEPGGGRPPIAESAEEAVIGTDLEGTILMWSEGAERLYGFTREEAVGRPVSLTVPEDRWGELESQLAAAAAGEARHCESCRRARSGEVMDVAVTVAPLCDGDGRIIGASLLTRDLTEQRWMASTLDAALGALTSALEEARAAEERSRRFLADAAHQLRTPVAGMRACAEALLFGASGTDRDDLLARVVAESDRASRLVGGLLTMARIDQGPVIAPTPTDVAALCREEADRGRMLRPDVGLEVRAGGGGRLLDVDRAAVREIVANLVDNSVRHARARVVVDVAAEAGRLRVRVTNDGPPVPDELAERIFERFVSLDGCGGAGLGLSIARELARAHGGGLAYEDGSFVLKVPLGRSDGT